jgi:hypothetical protein
MNSLVLSLLPIAKDLAAPWITETLSRRIGPENSGLVLSVIKRIARNAGVSVDTLTREIERNPDRVEAAITATEGQSSELIALYQQELEGKLALFAAENNGPAWHRAWRPLGMYVLFVLWIWNVIILHSLNAYFKIALPPIPLSDLLALTGIYCSLYMGGHTVKSVADSFFRRGAA